MWSNFESEIVDGRYPLGKLVRSEGRCAWFETRLLNEKPALISVTESLNDEASLLERLEAAEKVRHPNVVAVLETGAATVKGTPLVYALMEPVEENLEDVLRTRALTAEETRDVAEGLVGALGALHKERLGCGRLEAASVLAAGDTVKLRSDRLQVVTQDAHFRPFSAADVQGLGAVLYQCLTQRRPKLDGNDPTIQLLPPPFVQIVRRSLSGQASVDEIAALLRPTAATTVPVAAAATVPVAAATPRKVDTPVTAAASAPKPSLPGEKQKPATDESIEEPTGRKSAVWVVAGFVLLLMIAGFVVRAMMHSSGHTAPPVSSEAGTPAATTNPAPAPPAAATAPATAPPVTAAAAAQPAAKAPVAAPQSTGRSTAWRVVAFTYNRQEQAEHKANTISTKYSGLQAEVFSPKGNGAPYLVTLGGAMDREAAFQLRDKAIREGLPRDTYAQNYSH